MNGFSLLKVPVNVETDVVGARQKARLIADELKFERQDQVRLATAISELARNIYQYAQNGVIEFAIGDVDGQRMLLIHFRDKGPGIAELPAILNGTYVSPTGMGIGIKGSQRLMDFFEVDSTKRGTRVSIGKRLEPKAANFDAKALSKIVERVVRASLSAFDEVKQQNADLLNALGELQQSRNELSDVNRELAETNRGVVALYAELDEKAAAIQRANETKTRFLSNITHEFRTPLSSIMNLTRMLLDQHDGTLGVEQSKQVHFIKSSAENLLEIVNDLLDLAKVEAGRVAVKVTPFTLDDLFGSLRGMFRTLVTRPRVRLEFGDATDPEELCTDQSKVAQILRNLISNALKYTEAGSITVRADSTSNGEIVFSVTDTGIGIKAEDLASIFQDFTQIDSRLQQDFKGTGLGLPLSLKLARILGGELWVESAFGQGSTFYVRIPRVFSGERDPVLFDTPVREMAPKTYPGQATFRVLIVDDDATSRYIVKNLVRGELDADFIEVTDGQQALDFLRDEPVDLIVLDLVMPNMDGFAFLRSINNTSLLGDVPVIVNTSLALGEVELGDLGRYGVSILNKEKNNGSRADLRRALKAAGFDYQPSGGPNA